MTAPKPPSVLFPDRGRFDLVTCPLAGCDADLYITSHLSQAIYASDTAAELGDPAGFHTATWEVGCAEGHIVLLPNSSDDSVLFGDHDACDCAPDYVCPGSDLDRLRTLLTGGAS